MKNIGTFVLLNILSISISFAQKLNSAEEQIFKAEATKVIEQYYVDLPNLVAKLNDSISVKYDEDEMEQKITYRQQFIEKYFDNHDIYVYNDLSPDDDAKRTDQRVMRIEDYLNSVKTIFGDMSKEKLQTSLKSALVEKVSYNAQAAEKYYFAKIRVERKLKGMYLGKYFTENTKSLDFYVKTIDKPDTRLKTYKIIGIDFESKQIDFNKMSTEEAIAKGLRFLDEMDYENAFKYLMSKSKEKKFIKNGNATWGLGYMYFWGRGTERSDAEMVKWLEESAKQNNLYALHYMGENYYYGEYGVEEDEKKAFKYIKEAARKGFSESQFFLGERYEKGQGVKMDKKDAIKWYKKAAKQGHVKAKFAVQALEKKK